MKTLKDKILIIGGYGAVGKVVSKILAIQFPGKVIVGGRHLQKAASMIEQFNLDALPISIDISSRVFDKINFEEIHAVISCIEYLKDDNFILLCIKNKIHYTELATSYEAYMRLFKYKNEVEKSKMCLIPGVGLMPGLSGVFAQNAISRLNKIREVQSFILLGLGENHGLDAVRWMLEYADKTFSLQTKTGLQQVQSFADPLKERLLNENNSRTFYRFNFGDQYIISSSFDVDFVGTRLAFDSKFVTWLIVILKKMGLLKKLSKINPQTIINWLNRFRFGSEQYAVQTHCFAENGKEIVFLATGENEAFGTGVIASYAISKLYTSNNIIGFKRLEEILDFDDFVKDLQKNNINIKIQQT
jgi:saccharopine dehydrogenase-like NADP-dependent oxidoreductase